MRASIFSEKPVVYYRKVGGRIVRIESYPVNWKSVVPAMVALVLSMISIVGALYLVVR